MIKVRWRSTHVQSDPSDQTTRTHQEAALSDSTKFNSQSSNTSMGIMRNSNSLQKSKVARKVLNVFDAPRKGLLDKNKCKRNSPRKFPIDHGCSSKTSPFQLSSCDDNEHSMQIEDHNSYSDKSNLMSWLHDEAPEDILPKILSLAGPQATQSLSRVSKSWNKICTWSDVNFNWSIICFYC